MSIRDQRLRPIPLRPPLLREPPFLLPLRELLLRLFATDLPPHDVHGRATIVQLPREELERRFGRR